MAPAFAPSLALSRAASHTSTSSSRPTRVVPRMQTGRASIDFSNIDISAAGDILSGLVFTPEGASGAAVASRTRCHGVGYTPAQEAALNRHINVEYTAMYAYHALCAYFSRDTVALPGFAKYFDAESLQERGHAHQFMTYQGKRGGKVELFPVAVPEMAFEQTDPTSDALYALDLALQLEKFVMIKLQELHKVADDAGDAAMTDFVDGYLQHQVDAIKEAADKVAQVKRVGTGHGVYQIDRALLEELENA